MGEPHKVMQTILHSDPERLGNCLAACVASFFGEPLEAVPHFAEWESEVEDSMAWWYMLLGYMAGKGLWVTVLDSLDEARESEIVFVSGPSPRGNFHHQVLYKNGKLWHDPHPSSDGLESISRIEAWRPATHNHTPTE